MSYQKDKQNPSGCRRYEAYQFPERWNGKECLQPLGENQAALEKLRDEARKKAVLDFVTPQVAFICEQGMIRIGRRVPDCWDAQAWNIFADLVKSADHDLTLLLV